MEIQLWREILEPYELAVNELVVKFNHLISASRRAGKYSPIEQVNGRVKSISSILEKCQKKGITLVLSHVNDQPMHAMQKAGFDKLIGEENFCAHIDDALKRAEELL